MSLGDEVAPNSNQPPGGEVPEAKGMETAFTSWRRRRQQHQLLQEEGDSPAADVLRKKPSSTSLNTLRMTLRKRLPLQQVDFNSDHTPTWDSQKPGALQSLGRSARNTWGSVSQKLQKRRQSRSDFLVITPSKSPTPRTHGSGSASKKRTSPRTPRGREWGPHCTPRSGKPTSRNSKAQWREVAHLLDKDGFPLRRSVRSAALKSPYGSPRRISRQRQFDRDLESVSFGIGQLKHLSQDFEETITKGERARAIENYHHIMSENLRTAKTRAKKLSSSVRRRTRLCSTLSNWASIAGWKTELN